jgi:D-glycero-alpha-D-manno-heptose-7-phosphate kinase
VSTTIGLYAHASVEPGGEGILLTSEDLADTIRVAEPALLDPRGKLALLQSAVKRFPVCPSEVISRSEAPPGSGLGSSGALDVALVAALLGARGETLSRQDIAHVAWQLEVEDAGLAGGKQDQYMAALGGFRVLTFADPMVEAEPLVLEDAFARHLGEHVLLCYTGTSRISANTIARVMSGYSKGDATIASALHGLKETALRMREALCSGDLARVGDLLSENWRCQRSLDPMMQTEEMARLESAMAGAQVLGGKAAGAGAGGCMFFLVPDPARARDAAQSAGARILPVTLVKEGVRSW